VKREAKITSKGQITIPLEVRRHLGVDAGDRLVFESGPHGVRVRPVRRTSGLAKYRGIGNPGLESGRAAIGKWLRRLRGE